MNIVKKIAMIPLLVLIGILAASVYGALHNQISYTVSPEYFTRFKFEQFGIINFPQRLGASAVGVFASWWMGLIIGLILASVALIQKDARTMFKSILQSYAIVAGVALASGLIGLAYGVMHLSKLPPSEFSNWYIPDSLQNRAAFILAGSMHNFSYLGGVVGMYLGVWWQIHFKRRLIVRANQRTANSQKEGAHHEI